MSAGNLVTRVTVMAASLATKASSAGADNARLWP
jgi:hypothetical protein